MTPPKIDTQIKECQVCDMMVTLGLASATCESAANQLDKLKCQQLLKPLENKKEKAVDTLANIIIELGDDNLNSVLDRMNLLIYAATEKAKSKLIEQGKLNQDGSPKHA